MLSLVWPVAALGFLLAMAQESMTAADRIAEIFDAENEIADGDGDLARCAGRCASTASASASPTPTPTCCTT